MRILIYEYFTGGGLFSDRGPDPRLHPLLPEGRCMVRALTEDLARLPGVRLVQLQDVRLSGVLQPRGEIVPVHSSAEELEQLEHWSARVDGVILIAPELEGRLLDRCEIVQRAEGRLLSPDAPFVRLATDKCATARHLAARGVATPHAILLPESTSSDEDRSSPREPSGTQVTAGGERREPLLPERFPYPAVLKPIDGVGAMDTYLIEDPSVWPAAAAARRVWRLEQFCLGTPVSVSALCGPRGATLLPPCHQNIACDGSFHYLGGSCPLAPPLVRRACQLARQAFAALPATVGYVGIDLILADDPSAADDVVIEVNPRLTTSYIGLRHATSANLAGSMLAAARGESRPLFFQVGSVQFDAQGRVTSGTLTATASS